MSYSYTIRELELSINSVCNLRCRECGFFTPNQPKAAMTDDIIGEHLNSLKILEKEKIEILSLAILGGEPTLTSLYLEKAACTFSKLGNIKNIEVVSNGLYPRGLTLNTLKSINKLSISVYIKDEAFIDAWKNFVIKNAPDVKLEFRIEKLWDKTTGNYVVPKDRAQIFYKECWYKMHCATLERSRLFICSRAAKLQNDFDGLLLTDNTKSSDIINYLTRDECLSSCQTCVPSMKLGKVQGGHQPNTISIQAMMNTAIDYLNSYS